MTLDVRISKAGTFRNPVVVIGPLAFKFAKNEQGRACNLYEANLYRASNEERRALLCPVLWVASHGAILIMRAAVPLEKMMSVDEYVEFDARWRNASLEDNRSFPVEPGARNWGWLDGRIVALDYSTPAWGNDD
jgi:hypothetical protein